MGNLQRSPKLKKESAVDKSRKSLALALSMKYEEATDGQPSKCCPTPLSMCAKVMMPQVTVCFSSAELGGYAVCVYIAHHVIQLE